MSMMSREDEAGAAQPAATGPEDAKATNPASLSNVNSPIQPEEMQEGDNVPNGVELLDRIHAFLGRFICYPSVHAHMRGD